MNSLDIRKQTDLQSSFSIAEEYLGKNYLFDLTKHDVIPLPSHIQNITARQHIRLLQVTKIVYDKNEDITEKLINIYNTVGNLDSSLVLIIDSDGKEVHLYVGVRSRNVVAAKEGLEKSFNGNFPGTELRNLRNNEIEDVLETIFHNTINDSNKNISSVSGIPAMKDVEKVQYIQGLEKLLDAMRGEKFSALFLADPVYSNQIVQIRQGYETLYTELAPFQQTELSFGQNDSQAITNGICNGVTNTINDSLTKTQSYTRGKSEGTSHNTSTSSSFNKGMGFIISASHNNTKTDGLTKSSTFNSSHTDSSAMTRGSSKADTSTTNKSDTVTEGNSRNLQVKFENKTVSNLLVKIDEQLERLKSSEDFGLWSCACYFLADNQQTARVAATTYQAIMRGENSSIENSFINTWDGSNAENLIKVKGYLAKLHHPLIQIEANTVLNLPYVSPGTLVNGRELAIGFSLPRKSVSGIPVIESAEFGRNVWTYKSSGSSHSKHINLGNVFHMGRKEDTSVQLDLQSLAMHTFITGSTGSGKSNTVYTLLDKLIEQDINFLIVEPAKGEYKHIFGGRKDIHVYGTNPKMAPLIKINPFRFPNEVHVLEHIDRLIEIFNACWPMYAAMPAVLKEAIEISYEKCGWDLESSQSYLNEITYPTFETLLATLPDVINASAYSQDTKSDYNGALVTRVNSLTNGLIGRIFSDDEIENEKLFDQNCLIDISRIGSNETKSLIMGILFMRLHEQRMSKATSMNTLLKHVTVLEEAHHLLRRTSVDQAQESSNLQGKAVEMMTNAIAEMRTYGEGFIIVDQSPGLLDRSVIRNTNTKIILRLPDGHDREDIGSAITLNEDQIKETAKLKTGVAVVYQNDWLQPVLCQISEFMDVKPFSYSKDLKTLADEKQIRSEIIKILLQPRVKEDERYHLDKPEKVRLRERAVNLNIEEESKLFLIDNLSEYEVSNTMEIWDQKNFKSLSALIYQILPFKRQLSYMQNYEISQWNEKIQTIISDYLDLNIAAYHHALMQCVLRHQSDESKELKEFYFSWIDHYRKDGLK
ncbi:ATP-binding protein [Bacillus sp. JJ722]|uniref:ATP-binding protein n=1 Tax=Bacillus sp. JJ722 TaxID=3122973 RepID=UPI002FFFA4D2